MMVFLILGWIALGCFTMKWLIYRQEEDTPTLMILAILVYFGAPLILMSVLGA